MLNIVVSEDEEKTINRFHEIYYDHVGFVKDTTWRRTFWMGVEVWKLPMDLWIYQELICHLRPQLIIETGTLMGGSALYMAHLCDLQGRGEIVSIDKMPYDDRPKHPRITYLLGSSTDPGIVAEVTRRVSGKEPIMVILDSDHTRNHVLAELRAYHNLVTPGSYLIVEDTNVNGHPVLPKWGPGPMEAIQDFMRENSDFEIDHTCEKLLFTFNPSGYLRKRIPSA